MSNIEQTCNKYLLRNNWTNGWCIKKRIPLLGDEKTLKMGRQKKYEFERGKKMDYKGEKYNSVKERR